MNPTLAFRVLRKVLLAPLLSSSLLACKPAQPSLSNGQKFDLTYQSPAKVAVINNGTVQATLTEVNDSRCPTGVNCITAGNVVVTVTFTDAGTTQSTRLGYTRNYRIDSLQITLNKQGYWLQLLDLSPYPTGQNSSQPKVAALRLRPN